MKHGGNEVAKNFFGVENGHPDRHRIIAQIPGRIHKQESLILEQPPILAISRYTSGGTDHKSQILKRF
jgi:hypothetical protein